MALGKQAASALQEEPEKKRGRPRGVGCSRVKTINFDLNDAVGRLSEVAAKKNLNRNWDWDGKQYPKTKRSHGPHQEGLDTHAEVLLQLIKLAPNGYPDPYRLRDTFIQLHNIWHIFEYHEHSVEAGMSVMNRAMLASDRWRIMCKHCLMLHIQKADINFVRLGLIINTVEPVFETQAASAEVETQAASVDAPPYDSVQFLYEIQRPAVPLWA